MSVFSDGSGSRKNRLKTVFAAAIALILIMAVMARCAAAHDPSLGSGAAAVTEMDYGGGLFDTSKVHAIDIRIAPEDWQDLKERPLEKIKYKTDITIDGEPIGNVSCSTKGNSSLIMVGDLYGIDRYSLKLDFGKYEKGQKFHGIRKLNLNNSFADSTYMKDYLCYTMFRRAGIDSPLCSYAWVTVNGEDYGLFLAVEEVDKNFLERMGRENGVLYKPDSENLKANGSELDRVIQNGVQVEDYGKGSELSYRGEEIGDYPDIFNNTETSADEEDKMRVIRALKGLSEGKDLENYLDTFELVRYFAVQNYVLNYDGYTGAMLHNYYLYEQDGRLAMLPWDYNLAFASGWAHNNPQEADTTILANYGIDTPLLGAKPEQRPMWKWIADNDRYRQDYHRVMDEFLTSYFESGEFQKETDDLMEMLLPYVENDPTAFYSADRFLSASKTLQTFCLLRAESIRRQLDGKLSAKTQDQSADDRVDAAGFTIEDLS